MSDDRDLNKCDLVRKEACFIRLQLLLIEVMSNVQIPEGFIYTMEKFNNGWNSSFDVHVKITNIQSAPPPEHVTIRMELGGSGVGYQERILEACGKMTREERSSDTDSWLMESMSEYDTLGSGHTTFMTVRGMRTFDRHGIDDSFYIDMRSSHLPDWGISKEIIEQLDRVKKSRDRWARTEKLPGLNYTVTPEEKADITKCLKTGKIRSFYPSGMGTGHVLSTKKSRGSSPSKALADFFDVPMIYVSSFDHD